MPGTGKTTVITALLHHLVAMGNSVLLASYTNSAVDNVLIKLLDEGVLDFHRIGPENRIHPLIKSHSVEYKVRNINSLGKLKEFYQSKVNQVNNTHLTLSLQSIVASTCHSMTHPLFKHRHFDYCVIDEASQIHLPLCLGPLYHSNTFVLVGDDHQLPPLVQSPSAKYVLHNNASSTCYNFDRSKGYDISLFHYLSSLHPSFVIHLTHQYRMNRLS